MRWWILGFADDVEVIEPESLRNEIMTNVRKMRKIYLTLLGFSITLAIVAANDEFYCIKTEMYQTCKPCNFGKDKNNCEDRPSDKCKCDNLKMVKTDDIFIGYRATFFEATAGPRNRLGVREERIATE